MTDITNINWYGLSDRSILEIIGKFIQESRLQQGIKQEALADAAGINRSTLSLIEHGKGGTMISMIQILRALKKLEWLRHFQNQEQFSPIQLAKLQQKKPQRVGKNRKKPQANSGW